MSKKAQPVTITLEERGQLETVAASRTAPHRQVQRARRVLAAAEGKTNQAISQETGLGWRSVGMWRRRFIGGRLAGLEDRPRSGKPRQYSEADRLRVIEIACTQKPAAETHWSVRTLAKATGVGRDTVHTILRQANLKPHQVGTFMRSTHPDSLETLLSKVAKRLHSLGSLPCGTDEVNVGARERRHAAPSKVR